MKAFYQKSREWRLRVKGSLSVDHSEILNSLVCDKRVLDIGDKDSPFLARPFAAGARSWIMVGRLAPDQTNPRSFKNMSVINSLFSSALVSVRPSDVDIILLNFPSPKIPHDAAALQWATKDHLIVFLGDPTRDTLYGSQPFWELTGRFDLQMDARDNISRLMVLRKKPSRLASRVGTAPLSKRTRVSKIRTIKVRSVQKTERPKSFPRKGDRHHLSPMAYWPNKRESVKPPVVEIVCDWTQCFGPVKIIQTGEIYHIQINDLGGFLSTGPQG